MDWDCVDSHFGVVWQVHILGSI